MQIVGLPQVAADNPFRNATFMHDLNAIPAFPAGVAETSKSLQGRPSSKGVAAVGSAEYNANLPIEDRHAVALVGDLFLAAVFDGHGGWQVSEYARNAVLPHVINELRYCDDASAPTPDELSAAMVRAVERTDRDILEVVRPAYRLGFRDVSSVGSCVLLTAFTADGNDLVIANAGDCRAVLGTGACDAAAGEAAAPGKTESGLHAVALTNDHNSREPREQALLKAAHPGEPDLIRCRSPTSCYVKGKLQPTRSLGDWYLKLSEMNGAPRQYGGDRAGGRFVAPPYSPPYITATPEMSRHHIDHDKDRFLILATDGVWDAMTNQQAVDAVAQLLKDAKDTTPQEVTDKFVEMVLEREAANAGASVNDLKRLAPGRQRRSFHDDITVVIVFFGGGDGNAPTVASSSSRKNKGWWNIW